MATKREVIQQIPAADLRAVAGAVLAHIGKSKGKEFARLRKAAKILATAQAGRPQKEE